jgi:hypothetical protein
VSRSGATEAETKSKWLTGPRDDVIISMNSQMIFKFVDSLQIRMCACVEKVPRIKASAMVVAPL